MLFCVVEIDKALHLEYGLYHTVVFPSIWPSNSLTAQKIQHLKIVLIYTVVQTRE